MGFLRRLFGASEAPSEATSGERSLVDLRGEVPRDGYLLPQGQGDELYCVSVVGESKYRSAIERAVGRRPEGHRTILDAALVWEPQNRYDPNAIAVQLGHATCGYFPREEARAYRPAMERLAAQGLTAYARADVHGGWRLPDNSWADFGIEIRLESPEALLKGLGGEAGVR
jgi:hypothetical protein